MNGPFSFLSSLQRIDLRHESGVEVVEGAREERGGAEEKTGTKQRNRKKKEKKSCSRMACHVMCVPMLLMKHCKCSLKQIRE